jgi:hypothetical protein
MRRAFSTPLAILTAIAHLAHFARADYPAQINFYVDKPSPTGGCTQFKGEKLLTLAETGAEVTGGHDGECVQLDMPGNSGSLNTAAFGPAGDGGQGYCTFYDSYTCSGNTATSYFSDGNGGCRYSRSVDGWLWKSAICVETGFA